MQVKCDWISIDNTKLKFHCDRCGVGYTPSLPLRVSAFVIDREKFMKIHQQCPVIKTELLIEPSESCISNLLGYFAYGHHDKVEFTNAVNQQWGYVTDVNPDLVEHKYYEIIEEDELPYFEFSKSIGKPITLIEIK